MILTSVNSETTNGDYERDDNEDMVFYNENVDYDEHLDWDIYDFQQTLILITILFWK